MRLCAHCSYVCFPGLAKGWESHLILLVWFVYISQSVLQNVEKFFFVPTYVPQVCGTLNLLCTKQYSHSQYRPMNRSDFSKVEESGKEVTEKGLLYFRMLSWLFVGST